MKEFFSVAQKIAAAAAASLSVVLAVAAAAATFTAAALAILAAAAAIHLAKNLSFQTAFDAVDQLIEKKIKMFKRFLRYFSRQIK